MSVSLYRKYRPQTFADVLGQKAAIDVLTNSIAKTRVGHAYLFSGSRGCGKTSVARIFAKALNCLERKQGFEPCEKCSNCTSITAGESLDVIEIDGASNNGVDEVRELKANVTLAPFNSKYKIYIIDEVHMLSQAAFNALLKTLEEPPEHVIFIMATTEPQKVPVTIRSRCQHIPFHSITPEDIFARLTHVCKLENFTAESEALWEISRQADGALRDALSLLEQVTAAGDITLQNVETTFGAGSRTAFERWLRTVRENPGEAYMLIKSMFDSGASGVRVFEEMFSLVRNLWLVSQWPKMADTLGASENEKNFLREESQNWQPGKLHTLLNAVNKALVQARMGVRNDILLGMFLLFIEPAPTENLSLTPPPQIMPLTITTEESAASQPTMEISEPIAEEEHVEYDPALREELIELAYNKNSNVYYGLFASKMYKRGEALVIEVDNIYTYETLRVTANAANIKRTFDSYPSVILKFAKTEIECLNKTVNTGNETSDEVNEVDEISKSDHEKLTLEETKSDSEEVVDNKQSSFNKIRDILSNMGIMSEIVLLKRKDVDEENEPEEINVMELDLEAEAEGEDDDE